MAERALDVEDLVDRPSLRAYLVDHLGPCDRFAIERHRQGHSNETLFLDWNDRELVLRRPPPGETAESAHDVLREYEVIDALADTPVPVPPTVLACEDESVIECPFFVMERLTGDVLREDEPTRFQAPGRRERIGTELVDTLATIHQVDYQAAGLTAFGRPEGYLQRQVELFRDQLEEWLLERTEDERPVPGVRDLGDWLARNVPAEADHALVHGDFKLDNVMFGPGDTPRVVGVFDWEMSTLGDPLADLGYFVLFWRDGEADEERLEGVAGSGLTGRPGYETASELVSRYERTTNLTFDNRRFYRALAAYKLATACEAFFYRHLSGAADDPLYGRMAEAVPALVEHALAVVDGDRPL